MDTPIQDGYSGRILRAVVIADSHGCEDRVRRVLARQEAAVLFHLGDGLRDLPDDVPAPVRVAAGNNDWGAVAPPAGLEVIAGRTVFYTHGHHYGVKAGLDRVVLAARQRQAALLLFGHTHRPLTDYADGLYFFNPGSLRFTGTYGVVDFLPVENGQPAKGGQPDENGQAGIVARVVKL